MRYAFSSIELILSIIIISIALLSIPSIIQISYKSINNILLSEAITTSYTKISNIISHPWNNAINPALAQPIYHSDELPSNSLTQRHISQIKPNNINSDKTGGIVIKTTKNSVVSQVLLASDSDYGKVKITGDLCIGGRVSNTTALISSDAAHNMYISIQGKTLLVCDSNENSIRRGKN